MIKAIVLMLASLLILTAGGFRVSAGGETAAGSLESLQEETTLPLLLNVPVRGSLDAAADDGCLLHPIQYVFSMPDGGVCGPPDFGAVFRATGDGVLRLFVRFGERVEVRDGRIVADYSSEPGGRFQLLDVFVWSSPPARSGNYFVALANCGESAVNFEVAAGTPFIDFAGPSIFRAEVEDERVLIFGVFFTEGAELFLDGRRQKHVAPADGAVNCLVIAERAAKRIAPGQTVKLQLRFPGGFRTPKFKFTRPM